MSSKSTAQVYGSALVPLALVAGLALDGGGYAPTAWGWSTVASLALAATLLSAGLARRFGPTASVFLCLLTAFVGWICLSTWWSTDVADSVLDGERGLLYFAAAAALLLVGRPVPLLLGVLGAITLACAYGLGARIFGGAGYDVASAAPDAAHRLAEPLGYSNAVGAFAGLGVVLALGLAVWLRRPVLAAPVLVLAPTLYLTYSRGAWISLGAGAFAAASLRSRRRTAVAVAVAAALVLGLGAARYGGRVYRAFSDAGPTVQADQRERLLSLSGSNRAQYWRVAWHEYRSRPWLGSGAGTFQRSWLEHRPALLPVKDAHSLELETLAELGPVGLALLGALLAVPIAAAVRARRHPAAPAAFGAYAVFLVHSAQDWDWELPALTLAALVCAAALVLLPEPDDRPRVSARLPRAAGAGASVALAAVAVFAFVGNRAVQDAADALDRAQAGPAADAARDARGWMPWSSEPWRLLGEAQLEQGDLTAARRSFRRGLEEDDGDWELWLDLALSREGPARRIALRRASALNPLEPELRRLLATT